MNSTVLKHVDCVRRLIWKWGVIQRWKYFSSQPNTLWHCDGHHKLIKYGFIIHGFIDGNCHMVRCTVSMFVLEFFTFNIRLLPFMPVPTTLLVLSSNCSYQLQGYIVPHPGFMETKEEKTCSFLHIWSWNMVLTVDHFVGEVSDVDTMFISHSPQSLISFTHNTHIEWLWVEVGPAASAQLM